MNTPSFFSFNSSVAKLNFRLLAALVLIPVSAAIIFASESAKAAEPAKASATKSTTTKPAAEASKSDASKAATAAKSASEVVYQAKSVEKGLKFLAIGRPSAIKINGEGVGPKGDMRLTSDGLSGSLELDLTTIKTGIELRDEHMHGKYLQTKEFPKATLKFDNLALSSDVRAAIEPAKDGQKFGQELKGQKFTGTLNMHGQEQKVEGTFDLQRKSASEVQVNAKFTVLISQYKIDIPSYLGIKVAENVDIDMDVPMEIKQNGGTAK